MSLSLPSDRCIVPYTKNLQVILYDKSNNNVVVYDKVNEGFRAFKTSNEKEYNNVRRHSRLLSNTNYFKILEGSMYKSIHDFLVNGYYEKFFLEESRIGAGGFGTVYKVKHVIDNLCLGDYAVKKIPVGDDLKYLKSVLIEVNALEQLHRHPNIICYRHSWLEEYRSATFGPEIPCLFVLMDYANGGNMESLVLNNPPLSENMIWQIFYDIINGLSYLHSMGIIHRDIKPQNLLFHDNVCLISDFGTCISSNTLKDMSRSGYSGTIEWQAPELFKDEYGNFVEFNEKCDIWSVGLILYFLCYKELPWKNSNFQRIIDYRELINEIRNFDVMEIQFPEGRSKEIEGMIKMLLQKNPNNRPSASELVDKRNAQESYIDPSPPVVSIKDINEDNLYSNGLLLSYFFFIMKILFLSLCNRSIRLDIFVLCISFIGASFLSQTQIRFHKFKQIVPIIETIFFTFILLFHGKFGSIISFLLGAICFISSIPLIYRSIKKRRIRRKSTIILRPNTIEL